ncbi:NAD(P)/FAD-dependent oxidoreductase [Lysobacter enzymogenes]|uniref:NAD(P)/FAD-dependent oxidoreductase n=1 Tax=Lysobacter enzymogenes TaxID=69 RepID=UPI000895D08D|nr:NAD(P)/FAD-dependent oxidoreductase [Lysobacter enzymogenes]SDX76781.1 Thioredoxin reductase [Lysobacter enzymogenes]
MNDDLLLDAVVIGGSFAGLSAALQLARARRSVRILDAGRPRNRFADAAHGFFSRDGSDPRTLVAAAQAQLRRYPSARLIAAEAASARAVDGGFEVVAQDGSVLAARKLVLAFGVNDTLPPLPGLRERWGKSVLHCPYCHGYEFAGRRLGVLHSASFSAHQALLVADWGPTTLYLNGAPAPDADTAAQLARRGVAIEPAPIVALSGEEQALSALRLADGREASVDALFVASRVRFNSALAEQLGCAIDEGPMGPFIRTDDSRQTTVPGVYAAGDIARAMHNATWAAADGVTAGASAHQALVFQPLAA